MSSSNLLFDENLISSSLIPCDSPNRTSLNDDFFTRSAILFSILPHTDRPYELIIIHRTNRGRKHRGEMSFPGGKFNSEEDKTLLDTALREANEEIGVHRKDIQILGCLNDFPTMTKYIISPFVAKINPNVQLVKQEREVQEIIKVPIDFFVNKENFREQAFKIKDEEFPVFYFNYYDPYTEKGYIIWGATAHMISIFIERVYEIQMSELGLKRFDINKIRSLKDFIKYRDNITKELK
ncbi:MAG: NUDIX domain-containing protein [Candidatus Lokiarchaeota archaeon]|nr:NUDIX domain-containing protein [Candidatus Lokiarchaeota archaeon]MBD3200781.1 NUDIX domain-containing protein [Candidatus Lokiarchaeota archaeon]